VDEANGSGWRSPESLPFCAEPEFVSVSENYVTIGNKPINPEECPHCGDFGILAFGQLDDKVLQSDAWLSVVRGGEKIPGAYGK
jgi:hypothetical protein